MKFDAVVVGGGIAGLTATAYLARAGCNVLLCEKQQTCGGLVSSFERNGFTYDGGIRATEDSGVLFTMLRQLGLDIPFVRNKLSIGIGKRVIRLNCDEDVLQYRDLLYEFYPESRQEIDAIISEVQQIMYYMEVQYGIENPLFLDIKKDRGYFIKKIIPWIFKYAVTVPKINRLQLPVIDFLKRFTHDQSLLDMIAQHFFQKTPAFFALSYFKLYLDYHYPMGGTGKLVESLVNFIKKQGGTIRTNSEITKIQPNRRMVTDSTNESYEYRRLIWAADQKTLYNRIITDDMPDLSVRKAIKTQKNLISDKVGNDSVLTLFLAVNLKKEYFERICSEHFFYTAVRDGQSKAGALPIGKDRKTVKQWLSKFFTLTTYEISIPVLRDASLAPKGKTGLIISVLFDYRMTKQILDMGWYDEFKAFCEQSIIDVLDGSIFPGIKRETLERFSSTPVTIALHAGTTDGAIVGWAFTNNPVPAESRLPKLLSAIRTPIPGVLQAGQWTYSPSGLPIALITGKLSADQVIKELKKAK